MIIMVVILVLEGIIFNIGIIMFVIGVMIFIIFWELIFILVIVMLIGIIILNMICVRKRGYIKIYREIYVNMIEKILEFVEG